MAALNGIRTKAPKVRYMYNVYMYVRLKDAWPNLKPKIASSIKVWSDSSGIPHCWIRYTQDCRGGSLFCADCFKITHIWKRGLQDYG